MRKHRSRNWLLGAAGAGTIAVALLSATISTGASASPTVHHATRSHAVHVHKPAASKALRNGADTAYPVTGVNQQFTFNTNGFCTGTPNAPCDGNGTAGDYGTLDRVPGGFSNGGYGNYAPSTAALFKGNTATGYFALTDGTGVGNQGTGCPGTTSTANPGETCTGPFALYGTGAAAGIENVFPTQGFTATNDLYLSPSTAGPAGSLVDDDVELNASTSGTYGYYGIDNVITACAEQGNSALGFVINFGHGSPGSCAGTPVITTPGWYRFVFVFSNTSGNVFLSEYVYSEGSSTPIASSGPQQLASGSADAIGNWGGPGYFWLPSEDFDGLPLANFAVQLGQHPLGHTP
jgi:hypothetical protein